MIQDTLSISEVTSADRAAREARLGALFGWISAAAWILLGIDSIARPIQDNRRDIFWWFPFLFMTLTIIAVHRVQRRKDRRVERYIFWAVMIAWLLVLIGNLGLVFNIPALLGLGFPGGATVGAVGLIVFGVVTWRTGVLPRSSALALILWEPGSVATGLLLSPISPLRDRGSYSAGLWKGFAIAVLAYGMQSLSTSWTEGKHV